MKKPRLRIILLASVVFVVGLLVKFPASVGASMIESRVPGLSLGPADGTLWDGRVNAPQFRGRAIQSLDWELVSWRFLLLQVAADIELRIDGETVSASVVATPGGRIEVSGLRGNIKLASLERLRLMPSNLARGEVLLDIDALALEDNRLVAANGRAQLTGLESLLLKGTRLGDYAGTLENTDDGIRINFRDINAPLELQGQALLAADGSYRAEGSVRPTDETPDQLRQGMQFLGQPDSSGRHRFSFKGKL